MRKYLFLLAVGICACTATRTVAPQNPIITPAEYQAPVDFEFGIGERRKQNYSPVVADESQRHRDSVTKIDAEHSEQFLQYQMCLSVVADGLKDPQECQALLKNFCEVHMHIDSRGGHHEKPYCKKQ